MITIKMVAKKAEVSIGTVSNVLSKNRPVSEDVRQRVMQAIDEMGYQPNMIAHSLVTGRSSIFGMVVPDFTIEGLLTGIDSVATKVGYSLLVSKLSRGEDPIKYLRSLLGRRVDGIIWCIPETDHSHDWTREFHVDPGTPVVLAMCTPRPHYSTVWMDNFEGGYLATQHLLQHGCRKIAHITGPMDHRESKDRKAGWEKALQEAGIEPGMVVEGGWDIGSGWRCMQHVLEQWPDIDAVFVAADKPALGGINVLLQSGRRVPEDVKVIGFDDVIGLDFFYPPLASIHQDYNLFGARIIHELCRRIQDPTADPEAQFLSTYMVPRQSCGCITINRETEVRLSEKRQLQP